MGVIVRRPLLLPNTFDPPALQSLIYLITLKKNNGAPLLRPSTLKRNDPLTHPISQCPALDADLFCYLYTCIGIILYGEEFAAITSDDALEKWFEDALMNPPGSVLEK